MHELQFWGEPPVESHVADLVHHGQSLYGLMVHFMHHGQGAAACVATDNLGKFLIARSYAIEVIDAEATEMKALLLVVESINMETGLDSLLLVLKGGKLMRSTKDKCFNRGCKKTMKKNEKE
uniref:Uncharacterized protein n=1 Tax=Nelumbo nucifera TaxID=4432 RepID=A0A822XHU5_NELNU|nr:TPA_asm: hypothetical protein HUJ06_020039 [Nelumbo nucifera]